MLRRGSRRGATAVEMALVLPIIFSLFFGFWEWSRVEMIRQASTTASFEAARRGTIPSANTAEMDAIAQNILDAYFVDGATISSSINMATSVSTASITVPLDQNLWSGGQLFGGRSISVDYSLQLEVTPD